MSKEEDLIERRLCAVIEYKSGALKYHVCKKYHIGMRLIELLVERYDRYGVDGLRPQVNQSHYPEGLVVRIMQEYDEKGISLKDLSKKYLIREDTLKGWVPKYEQYKKGDKFAFNGGRIYQSDFQHPVPSLTSRLNPMPMEETKQRKERRKELSKLSKEELYELLLDRECELDLLKKVDALVKKRESRLRATGRKSSKG